MAEICLVACFCVQKNIFINLSVHIAIFHVSCFIIIEAPLHFLNIMVVISLWCTLISGSKSVSMVILNLRDTAENASIFAKGIFLVKTLNSNIVRVAV